MVGAGEGVSAFGDSGGGVVPTAESPRALMCWCVGGGQKLKIRVWESHAHFLTTGLGGPSHRLAIIPLEQVVSQSIIISVSKRK